MQILTGYHKGKILEHREEDRDGKFLEVDPKLLDESKAITCPMQPGDALLFPNLTMHRSLPSTSPLIRWSIDIRYLRDGDHPGTIYWPNPSDKWVVKSATQPHTTLEQWLRMTADLPW
jgi:ectoine hydroxylase-related dioxygenase (phytanoyl-CoA dioxygenase family)